MNLCTFAPMFAYILSHARLFLRETGKFFQKILLGTKLVSSLKSNFVRTLALVLVAIIGWMGISWGPMSGEGGALGSNEMGRLVVGEVVWANAVSGGGGGGGGVTAATPTEGVGAVKTVNAVINILYALLTPLLMLAGWLLTPDWAFGEIFGMRPVLHDMWILVSNIVYVIFAFLLVAMAFMNIFGAE